MKILQLTLIGFSFLVLARAVNGATAFQYQYETATPLECCGEFDTFDETVRMGVYGNGNLNNGRIGNQVALDAGLYRDPPFGDPAFAYQVEGTPGAGTEFNGTYTDQEAADLSIDFGSVQTNLGTLRIDYNTNPSASFGKPGDITISDGFNSVTILSSSLPAASDGAGNGVYQFVLADISSLSGQILTVNIGVTVDFTPPVLQYLGINELTFTPLPEPSSVTLLGFGLATMIRIARRKRNR